MSEATTEETTEDPPGDEYVERAKAQALVSVTEMEALGYIIVRRVEKILKNSARITMYGLKELPVEETPTPTIEMTTRTAWVRRDGNGAPEKPEVWHVPAFQLANFIMEHGKKL